MTAAFGPLCGEVVTHQTRLEMLQARVSTSSKRCVFKIVISVHMKCCRPTRNILHLEIAQQTATISNSITAYHISASDKNRDPA